MKSILLTLIALLPSTLLGSPLETARSLARGPYADWTYGSSADTKTINCVQFMEVVIAKEVARPLTTNERRTIAIHHGWTAEQVQTKAAAGTDPNLSGLAHALVDLMQVAERVEPTDAKPGDFIQYWKRNGEGKWFGHASLLSTVSDGKAVIYGSHKSTNGIANSNFELNLTGEDRHVYIVRLKENLTNTLQTSRDGTMWLPKEMAKREDNQLTWKVSLKRWGIYDLKAHGSDSSTTATLKVLDQSTKDFATGLRVYFPKAGDYTIQLTDTNKPPVLSLTPAPEGRTDLAEADGKVMLHSRDATVRGQILRYEPNPKKLCLGFWATPHDRAEWTFELKEAGTFEVQIDQGCGKGHGGSTAYVSSGDQELKFTVEDTGHFQNFVTRSLGNLNLSKGTQTLSVGAHHKLKGAVMDVQEIRLMRKP